jgi:DNA-binding FadR family transcriptional regulator
MVAGVPQARTRITTAQRRILEALTARDTEAARTWMSRYLRDFRRGYELANISLDQRVAWRSSSR